MTTAEIQKELFNIIPQLSPEQQKELYEMAEAFSITKPKKKRQAGTLKGKIKMAPDFDEPLDFFKDYRPE